MAAHVAQTGSSLVGALTLPAWDCSTLRRKIGQWGWRDSLRYAVSKAPLPSADRSVRNPYLQDELRKNGRVLRSLYEVGHLFSFPVEIVPHFNADRSLEKLQEWSPDLIIFTGGGILREPLLKIPRIGVLNAHLARLPDIRGMSSPEWSLLRDVPLCITIHFMDRGIDTGPIVLCRRFEPPENCGSLTDLRNRMIAQGIEWMGEAIQGIRSGDLIPKVQSDGGEDTQYFVMHERLKALASERVNRSKRLMESQCRE